MVCTDHSEIKVLHPTPIAWQAQARNATLLAGMQASLAASQSELRNLQLRVAKYSEAYQQTLKSQGLAPDYSIAVPALDAAARSQREKNIALKEEKAQAGLFSAGDKLLSP
jgi:hypothetical protein